MESRLSSKLIKSCKLCGKQLKVYPSRVKRGRGKFCSKVCYDESKRNKSLSVEHRAKIGAALRGRRGVGYGKHLSEEHRANISAALKGKRGSCLGRHLSEEHKARLRGKSHPQTEEIRRKISIANKGRHLSEEAKAKLSLRQKENWKDPEYRNHHIEKQKAKWTPERRTMRAKSVKELWQNPEYVAKQMQANNVKPNTAELHLGEILNKNFPNQWKYVGDGQLIIGGKCPDFANINGQKRVIELFGAYWHPIFDIAQKKQHYGGYGFELAIIWEDELDNERRLVNMLERKFSNSAAMRVEGYY
jgi:hypothetical protein